MSGILDYIKWRGDLPLQNGKIDFIDNVVLCQLSYLDMLPGIQKFRSATVRTIFSELDKINHIEAMLSDLPQMRKVYADFFRAAAESERYGNIVVADYEEIKDVSAAQFCAMRFVLNDTQSFVAFRGTDDTIIGWKEDFMACYRKTYAQSRAISYLAEIIAGNGAEQEYFIGGHSKGGNLAMISSASLPDQYLKQVKQIFVNDGPGICEDVMDIDMLERIQDIAIEAVPKYCVIGKLFNTEFRNHYVIDSDGNGMLQHSLMTWQFDYGIPRWCDSNDSNSSWLSDVINSWMKNADIEERDKFVCCFLQSQFAALRRSGQTISRG